MEPIESFGMTLQLLKDGAIVFANIEGKNNYFALIGDKIRIRNSYTMLHIPLDEFIKLYGREVFYEYEMKHDDVVDTAKDEEYYRYWHK